MTNPTHRVSVSVLTSITCLVFPGRIACQMLYHRDCSYSTFCIEENTYFIITSLMFMFPPG